MPVFKTSDRHFHFFQQEFIKFWPEEDQPLNIDTGMFKLGFREEETGSLYTTRDFLLIHTGLHNSYTMTDN